MKKILKLVIYILALGIFLAGCAGDGEKTGAEAELLSYEDDSVYANLGEDTLWLAVCEFDTFNPVSTKSASVVDCSFLVYDPLFAPDSNMKMKPVLAESYSVSESGTRYTIVLNQNFKFHDGSDFGAKDVYYTVNQLKDLGLSSLFYENISNIEKVTVADDKTIVFKLYSPESLFINNLCFPIVKKGTSMTDSITEPIGTGPYKFKKSSLVRAMYFEANEDYAAFKPKIKNAVVKILPERDMMTYALQARQVDAACVTAEEMENYNPKGGVDTVYYNNRSLTFMGINTTKKFLSYSAVRKSISKAVDRADIVNSVLFGKGEPALLPYPKESYIYPEKYKEITKDFTEAEMLLDKAGFLADENGDRSFKKDDDTTIQARCNILVNSENDVRIAVGQKVCDALYQVGIDAKLVKTDFNTYKKRIREGEYDMYIGEIKMDLSYMMMPLVGSSANYSIFSSKELDSAIYKTLAAKDEEQTAAAYGELSDCLTEQMPIVCLYFGRDAMIRNSNLNCGGYTVSGCEFSNISQWIKNGKD